METRDATPNQLEAKRASKLTSRMTLMEVESIINPNLSSVGTHRELIDLACV